MQTAHPGQTARHTTPRSRRSIFSLGLRRTNNVEIKAPPSANRFVKPFEIFSDKYKLSKGLMSSGPRVLGEGKFGKVLEGYDKRKKRKVAIKIISVNEKKDIEAQEIIRESKLLKRLNHENIIKLFDLYHDSANNTYYMILELVQGGDLLDLILERWSKSNRFYDPLPEKASRSLIIALGKAISYLHRLGIVHRDIKPENIGLKDKASNDFSTMKLLDFGFSRKTHHGSSDTNNNENPNNLRTRCGTNGYFAPEVVLQKRYSKACDLWGAGIVLYIVLIGSHPFPRHKHITLNDEDGKFYIPAKYGRKIELLDYKHFSLEGSKKIKFLPQEQAEVLTGLLEINPEKRLTAEELLEKSWLRPKTEPTHFKIHRDL